MEDEPAYKEYLGVSAEYLSTLTPAENQARRELLDFIQKTTDSVSSIQQKAVAEGNEYERQYTGFFALAISFIIAGLLNALPEPSATLANKVLFFCTILFATIAALILFLEYEFGSRFFHKTQNNSIDILEYIAEAKWEDPSSLATWIDNKQREIPLRSKKTILRIEQFFVLLAFTTLVLWLIEALFNPDWPSLSSNIFTTCLL